MIDLEQERKFNDRLSQWMATQGFWFQLRHGGGEGRASRLWITAAIKMSLIALIAGLVTLVYLERRVTTLAFREGLERQLSEGLGLEEIDLPAFSRHRGIALIPKLEATGGPGTFFEELRLTRATFPMGLWSDIGKSWRPGTLRISRLEVRLKAGAENQEHAAAAIESLLRDHPGFSFNRVEVQHLDLFWGYSKRTAGEIRDASAVFLRGDGTWTFQMNGGRFSQNWLRNFEIARLEGTCSDSRLQITAGQLRDEWGGEMKLLTEVAGGVRPVVSGTVELEGVSLRRLLPSRADAYVEGTVSGVFELGGSTNSQSGVTFEGKVALAENDRLSLRDRLPLLSALSSVDGLNSYRRVDFHSGSFRLKTADGALRIEDLDLRAGDLMALRGHTLVRPPNDQEIQALMKAEGGLQVSQLVGEELPEQEEKAPPVTTEGDRLRLGANLSFDDEEEEVATAASLVAQPDALQDVVLRARQRAARTLWFEGDMTATIAANAFGNLALRRRFETDDSGRIIIPVRLAGPLYSLTLELAEEIHTLGRN